MDDQQVTLRGFLYKTPDGVWVLSQEPNLKSCCVGSDSKAKDQVFVYGELSQSSPNIVAEVSGNLQISQKQKENGELIQFYSLHNAQLVERKLDYGSLMWFGIVFLGLGISALLFRYWKRVSQKT